MPTGFIKMIMLNGVQLLGIADERGRIAPGFAADIIVTSSNPLEDIAVLKRVTFVMTDGKARHFDRLHPAKKGHSPP